MVSESEHSIRKRIVRARELFTNQAHPRNYLDDKNLVLTGRIFAVTMWRTGKGEQDFSTVLGRQNHKITKVIRIDWLGHGSKALTKVIKDSWNQFRPGDIVAIVRGGGDTNDAHFSPFKDESALKILVRLRNECNVILVTGIGHASDSFLVEEAATFKQATPTDAGYKICELLDS